MSGTRWTVGLRLLVAGVTCMWAPAAAAQDSTALQSDSIPPAQSRGESQAAAVRDLPPLFTSETPLEFSIRANFRSLHRSRTRASGLHSAVITYTEGGATRELPLQVRSRGIYRLRHCELPPLRLQFNRQAAGDTPFAGVRRGRLVMHCRNSDEYEDYVLREYQIYRMLNVLTPLSHRARLARVTYVDSASGRNLATRYAFIMEDDAAMAQRNAGRILEQQGARPGDLDPFHDALVGVFQFMVGNVDWSIAGLHNVMIVGTEANVYPVAYDFDFAGAVNTRYAVPDARLGISSVRERLMRGYCVALEDFDRVFALFNEKQSELYALYQDELGRLLAPATVRETLAYYDEFYRTINDPRAARERIIRACRGG
jgi:hypothetical protein